MGSGVRRERRSNAGVEDWTPWRWPVDIPATMQEHGSCPLDVKVLDLSLTGCRLWAGFRLTPGRPARIVMDGFAPFRGRVTWAENWCAAVQFDQLLHGAVLNHLVTRHPQRVGSVTEEQLKMVR